MLIGNTEFLADVPQRLRESFRAGARQALNAFDDQMLNRRRKVLGGKMTLRRERQVQPACIRLGPFAATKPFSISFATTTETVL